MPENFHSPFHWSTKAGQTAEGRLIYDQEQRWQTDPMPPPPGPSVELGPFGKKFLGSGLILLGLWIAPGPGAPDAAWILPGGSILLGALGLLRGTMDSWGAGWDPFAESPGLRGAMFRVVWALRPRSWMIAWVLIIGTIVVWGSPHLRVAYGGGTCTYFGLSGIETLPTFHDCPLVKVLPLR